MQACGRGDVCLKRSGALEACCRCTDVEDAQRYGAVEHWHIVGILAFVPRGSWAVCATCLRSTPYSDAGGNRNPDAITEYCTRLWLSIRLCIFNPITPSPDICDSTMSSDSGTVVALKSAFLRSQIRILSQPLQPTDRWRESSDIPASALLDVMNEGA